VIPGMIRKLVEAHAAGQRSVVLWGDGSPTREFLYVDDAARLSGWHSRATMGRIPSISDRARSSPSARWPTEYAMRLDTRGNRMDISRPNGQPRRRLDTSRARERFGFSAQTTFARGLRETIDWYLSHRTMAPASQP